MESGERVIVCDLGNEKKGAGCLYIVGAEAERLPKNALDAISLNALSVLLAHTDRHLHLGGGEKDDREGLGIDALAAL